MFIRVLILLTLIFGFSGASFAFESSFPFPFEFGHSSDIYLNVKKPETKQIRQERQMAEDMISQLGISKSPEAFVKYIRKNNLHAVKLLLQAGRDPNSTINANYPIYYAARFNRSRMISLLLEYGADPNREQTSPVRFAILHKDYNSVKMMVDAGANVNYTDVLTDETLLYTALKKKQYDIARLLIQAGAKKDAKSYRYIVKKKLAEKLGVMID